MKRILTLILLLLLVVCGLFAQKKSTNKVYSLFTLETGMNYCAKPHPNFSMPLNIEFQRVKKKFGLGAAIGLDFDQYSFGDCNRRVELNSFVILKDKGNFGNFLAYCSNDRNLNIKPSFFGSFIFLQKKKMSIFTKIGFGASILKVFRYSGEYYEYEAKIENFGLYTYRVINQGPIHRVNYTHSWGIDNIDFLSSLGLNYVINKRLNLCFTVQSETKLPILNQYNEKGVLFSGLCGFSLKL